jgi:hypothetical protein
VLWSSVFLPACICPNPVFILNRAVFSDGTQRYGIMTSLVTVTHWMNMIDSELGKNKFYLLFTPIMLSQYETV